MNETRRITIIATRRRTLRLQAAARCPVCAHEVEPLACAPSQISERKISMNKQMVGRVLLGFIALSALVAIGIFISARVSGQTPKGWRVWVKTAPCSGRTDWISVAQENPGFGGTGYYQTADLIQSPLKCTREIDGCTFAAAMAVADMVRTSPKFFNYCCRDYSVWENTITGELSVLKGQGSRGFGWRLVPGKADLCCEEAEAFVGKTGLCGGTHDGGVSTENNVDRPGHDYRNFDLPQPNADLCRNACMNDPNCKAYTYVKPGNQGAAARCWLKSSIPPGAASACCISGVKSDRPNNNNGVITRTGITSGGRQRPPIEGVIPNGRPGTGNTSSTGGSINSSGNVSNVNKPVGGRWELVSATVTPETPPQGGNNWSYNARSTSAQLNVYNGDKATFQWTPPPPQFDGNGFTVTVSAQAIPAPKSRIYTVIGVSGSGLTTDTPRDKQVIYVNGENGNSASGQTAVSFKPEPRASEIEVKVGMQWGITFTYKYRRVQ